MQHRSTPSAADILIPVHNQYNRAKTLVESIYRCTDYPFHIYLLGDGASDGIADLGKIFSRDITVARTRRCRTRAGAFNHGIKIGTNPYVVFMSNDVEVAHGWLQNLIRFLDVHPRIGAVGPLDSSKNHWQGVDCVRGEIVPQIPQFFTNDLHERNRILQFHFEGAGILVDRPLDFFCTAFPRRALDAVGRMNDSARGRDDADYCRRLRRAGFVLGLSLSTYVARLT